MAEDTRIVTFPDQGWLDDVAPLPDGLTGIVWTMDEPPAQALGEQASDVVAAIAPYMKAPAALKDAHDLPNLTLVQSLSAGVDNFRGVLPDDVPLANAAGVHDTATSELALALVLAALRGLDDYARDKTAHRWDQRDRRSLAGRSVLVIGGTGHIGSAIVRRLEPFETARITRVGSTARDDDRGHAYGFDDLPGLLPEHDVVILQIPGNDRTNGMVDAGFLAALPDGALVVNMARGSVLQTDALLAELRTGRIHAALDVYDTEPLPQDHPIWDAPNLTMSPHVGGRTDAFRPRAVAMLREQLGRLARGDELINLVPR